MLGTKEYLKGPTLEEAWPDYATTSSVATTKNNWKNKKK